MNDLRKQSWNDYWAGAQRAGVSPHAGAQDPALRDFWLAWFTGCALADDDNTRILDLGCGHGAVTAYATSVARNNLRRFSITSLDSSQAAVDLVKAEHPGVATLCTGAEDIPLPDAFFDHIVSQFGIEYAPLAAADEVSRTLRRGGTVAFIMHLRDGAIYDECRDNRDALDAVTDSNVIPAFIHLMEENKSLREGRGSRSAFEQADRELSPCVKDMEAVFVRYGREVGGGIVFRTYADIAHMYRKMNAFDPQEVIAWAERAGAAMTAWRDRMQSMLDAALDEDALAEWRVRLAAGGIVLEEPKRLAMGEKSQDGAWVLKGTKQM